MLRRDAIPPISALYSSIIGNALREAGDPELPTETDSSNVAELGDENSLEPDYQEVFPTDSLVNLPIYGGGEQQNASENWQDGFSANSHPNFPNWQQPPYAAVDGGNYPYHPLQGLPELRAVQPASTAYEPQSAAQEQQESPWATFAGAELAQPPPYTHHHHPNSLGVPPDEATMLYYCTSTRMSAGDQQLYHMPDSNSRQNSTLHAGDMTLQGSRRKLRRRVPTIAQRKAANVRERKRMYNLNKAFDILRQRVPRFAYEKNLSRIETLRLAMGYMEFMADILKQPDREVRRHYGNAAQEMSAKWSAPI